MNHLTLFPGATPSTAKVPVAGIEFMSFPGGERHVRLSADLQALISASAPQDWTIRADLYSAAHTMDLLLVVDALRRVLTPMSRLHLLLPYVPYARQDRVAVEGESLSLKVFTNLINSMGFASVEVWDPHSDVTLALLDNVKVRPTLSLMQDALRAKACAELLQTCAFVAPDAGARKRVAALAKACGTECVFADKVRDLRTGALSGASVEGVVPNKPLLVVDDICDGGGTFIALAQVLQTKTKQPLYLYVTHGLFTKGVEVLNSYFTQVFCANQKLSATQISN